jgi:glycosyltransferase involved in cell wall biosynthesis
LFVAPDLEGRATGGTLYNRRILAALAELGVSLRVTDLPGAFALLSTQEFEWVWLDSLYLGAAPELRERLAGRARLGLLLHYLPALVALGANVTSERLSQQEREALAAAEFAWVTSDFMRETAVRCGFDPRFAFAVEPACELEPHFGLPSPIDGLRAILVAHVVSGKGIDGLLSALACVLQPGDRFTLRIIGDPGAEPGYAARCRALIDAESVLSARVTLVGSLPEAQVVAELQSSNLLVSASLMESYGMALAEARRMGVPLVARDAGNVRAHVRAEAGGELVRDSDELARACARLCRNPAEHVRRLAAAQQNVPPRRTWRTAALELVAALQARAPERR